jgi:dienelactone hydrolase
MVTMRRRVVLGVFVGAAGTGALTACSAGAPSAVRSPSVAASAETGISGGTTTSASAAPILASTRASSLAARTITARYVPPSGTAPAQPFEAARRQFSFARGDRPLPTTVWYPATAGRPASGRFPVILFSHGLDSAPGDFADMLRSFAAAGFVVAAPAYPHTSRDVEDFDSGDLVNQPADASSVLDRLLGLDGDPLRAILDPDRLAAGGHSGGGITTDGLFSARRDERLKAGLVISGTDFQGTPFTGPPAAMLFVHGVKDDSVTYRAGRTVFRAVPWSRAMLTITDGGHDIDGASFDTITGTATEFFRWALYGDGAAKSRIPAAAAADGVATLDDQL